MGAGLGLGLGSELGRMLGAPDGGMAVELEPADGVVPGDPLAVADALAVAVADALVECDGVGLLVSDSLLPSELFIDWPVSLDGEAGGRMVVAAPFMNAGPLPPSSVYPPKPRAATSPAATKVVRRRLRRALAAS